MKETLEELLLSTDNLYDVSHYGSYEEYVEFLKSEHEFYNSLNFIALTNLIKITEEIEDRHYINRLENYEVSIYNDKMSMIIRRINNMLIKYFNRCYEIYVPNQMINIDKKKYLVMRNIEGSLNELTTKIMVNIDIKFLYFMLGENNISNEKKGLMIANMMYLNPFLQEKILAPRISFEPFIKEEDLLYNNLWENIKLVYENELNECCNYEIEKSIDLMLSGIDFDNKENVLIRKCYLRSLFNFLDEKKLEDLNYEYNNDKKDFQNEYGYQCIKDAFRSIKKDKETIKKIKTKEKL